jgi:hypothetical protein
LKTTALVYVQESNSLLSYFSVLIGIHITYRYSRKQTSLMNSLTCNEKEKEINIHQENPQTSTTCRAAKSEFFNSWRTEPGAKIVKAHHRHFKEIFYTLNINCYGARGSVVVEALCCKPEGRGRRPDEVNNLFPIYPILPAALGPVVYSASNRNEYLKQKNTASGE